jgi:ABC-type transport system substrate-binding protein
MAQIIPRSELKMKKLNRWSRIGIVALIVIALVLAGCSSKQNNGSSTPSGQTGSSPGGGSGSSGGGSGSGSGGGGSADGGVKKGGTLKLAIIGGFANIGYVPKSRSLQEVFAGNPAMETLGRYTPSGEIVPYLAEGWDIDVDAPAITYKLKKGIKFHDGTDFNAEAVKYNAEKMLEAKRSEFVDLESVDVLDEHTVRFNLKVWNSSFVETVANFLWIFSPTALEQMGEDGITFHPVGTGPYKFLKYEPDVGIYYTKFEGYWQEGKPHLDEVRILAFADDTTARFSFESKEIDGIFNVSARNASELATSGYNVLTLKTGLGALASGIITDHGDPNSPFKDVRVRKALGHAIDVDAIIESMMFGYAIKINQWGSPTAWTNNPEVEGTPYNPEKAKQLLAEAGYPNGFKTKMTVQNNQDTMNLFTAIQGYLAAVGIEAEIEAVETGKYREITSAPNGEWDGIISYSFRGDADLSMYMPRNFTPNGPLYANNLSHPPIIEQLLNEAKVAKTQEEKKRILQQVQKEVWDNHAMAFPMFLSTSPSVLHTNVQGTAINETNMTFWEPENTWKE